MGQFCASIRSPVTDSKGHLLNEANLASSTTSSEELAQNGRATRGCCGRVSEMFGAAIGGLAPHTFKFGNFLATAVMVGVAVESVLQKIVEAVTHALDTTTEKSHFDAAVKNST